MPTVVQPVADPGNHSDYVRLLRDGVLIDLGGRPLRWEPCPDCKGERTSGSTCPMAIACRHCGAKPRQMCKRPSEHDAADLHKARYNDAKADDSRRADAGDLTVPAPWPKETTMPAATISAHKAAPPVPAAMQGDLFAGLLDLTTLVADNAAKPKRAPRPRAKKAAPAVVSEPATGPAEFERRLATVSITDPVLPRRGAVPAASVAADVLVEVDGVLPTGEKRTLRGYAIEAFAVGANYQGWTASDCVVVTVAEHPDHLDGVRIAVPCDGQAVIVDPDASPLDWSVPGASELFMRTGLRLGPKPGPRVVAQPRPTQDLAGMVLSSAGGPAGSVRPMLKQDLVDKAIADGVWKWGVESGAVPLRLAREGATGTLAGLVDGREETVRGKLRRFWSESVGTVCSATVGVHMEVAGPGGGDSYRVVTVRVPWTGATFYLGDSTPPPSQPDPVAEQGDLFAGLLELTGAIADAAAEPAPPSGTIPLAEANWGMYGEVSAAWGPDGGKASRRHGYLVELPRIYTGGISGHSAKTPKGAGKPLLLTEIEVRDNGSASSLYCPPDATFTIMDPPEDHKLHTTMRLSRRLPFADLRPGDVFYIWDERDGVRDLHHRGGWNVADLRTRFHVQTEPAKDGTTSHAVDVLVDGEGEPVTMRRASGLWTDIADPREQPCNVAGRPPVDLLTGPRRALADRLGPDATVLAAPDGVVAVKGDTDEKMVGECFGQPYRWWFTHESGTDFYRPVGGDQYGPIGGRVGSASDGLDEVRKTLAAAAVEHDGLRLPRDLEHTLWEQIHEVLRGMGATGGARKGQSYTVKDARLPELWAFIAGGPAPKHERTTAGWVRTPDKLAADIVARFADLDRTRVAGHTGCDCCTRLRVLEPSAGDGSLVAAVLAAVPDADLIAVEPDPGRAEQLRAMPEHFPVHQCTLEELTARFDFGQTLKGFNLIVMNPPYSVPGNKGLWALHVKLAWQMLAEGGRLVAILPGDLARQDMRMQRVLELVGPDVQTEQLPKGSFRQPGKGGTDIDTWVLAATKQPGAEAANVLYAASIYQPTAGEPVQVDRVLTNRGAALGTPVQAGRDFGGDFVARYVGRCIVCTVSCWGRDDGGNDPRGVLGLNAVQPLRADENGMAGPDVCLCFSCADSGIMYERGLTRARTLWAEAEPVPLTFTGVCPDCGAQTEAVPAEGDGDTWKSAEQWVYLALQDHKGKCPARAAEAVAEAEAHVAASIAALLGESR